MKRSVSATDVSEHSPKRRRIESSKRGNLRLKHRQPGATALVENPQNVEQIDREVSRSICIALHGFGFDAVTSLALESFRAAVQEYTMHLTHKIQKSMNFCRRTRPLPQDFIYALSKSSLSPESLLAEHDLKVPASISQASVIPQPRDAIPSVFDTQPFLAREEGGAARRRRPYIPRHFPSFPGEHAYQETPLYAARETDALKIRERAMEEGQEVEHALRKLMAAKRKTAKGARGNARQNVPGAMAEARKMFLAASRDMVDADGVQSNNFADGQSGTTADGQSEQRSTTAVNYDRRYWRLGSTSGSLLGE